jgi:hypothetical protein
VLLVVGAHLLVQQVRVQLDLIHRGNGSGLRREALHVLDLEVRHANRARAAVLLELLERLPGGHVVAVVERGEGPVDQEQVHVVEPELAEGAVERPAGLVGPVIAVVELAGHIHIAPVERELPDRLADAPLVSVHLGRVDVPVADLERLAHGWLGLRGVDLEDAEAELRDRVAVVQFDVRDAHAGSCTHSRASNPYTARSL